jgi:hypothetical protein
MPERRSMTIEENPSARRNHIPCWPLAAVSAVLIVSLLAGSRLGLGRTPYRSVEILIVPALTAMFMFPAYVVARKLPSGVYARLRAWGAYPWLARALSVVIVAGLLLTVWIAFGAALQAQWGIIDDHEIMHFLGGDGKLTVSEIPSLLMQTEVGTWGSYARYRPAYYLLRLLETAAWGMNPMLWYSCRLALVGLAIAIWWKLVSGGLGKLGAGLLCMYTLTFPYWDEFTGRLGPSETYVIVGLPIYIAGVAAAVRADWKRSSERFLANAAILVGALICIGSKENLLLLALPSAYLLARAAHRRDGMLLASAAGSLFFGAFVAGGILLSVSRTGLDIYDKPVAVGLRLAEIVAVLRDRHFVTPFSMLVGVTAAVGALSLLPGWTRQQRNVIHRAAFWLVSLCLVFAAQLVYYNANWPVTIMRYGYPGLLYYPASILVLYGLARDMLSEFTSDEAAQVALKASLVASLVVVIVYHEGYAGSIRAMQANVARTREFTSRLERLVARLKQDESLQLVVESSGVRDYEPVFGYPRFLRAYQVWNPMLLRLNGYGSGSFSPSLEQSLAAELETISLQGNTDYLPLSSLEEQPDRCLSFFLRLEYPTGCEAFR